MPYYHKKSYKADDLKLDFEYLKDKKKHYEQLGVPVTKWVLFCEEMLKRKYRVYLYEARFTYSKYITVKKGKFFEVKVRFSNHKPSYERELANDCDIWVGAKNKPDDPWINWEQAVKMIEEAYVQNHSVSNST